MSISRRKFLGWMGAAGVASTVGRSAGAATETTEFVGTLVDTTRCIGCRRCEEACAKENGNPVPDPDDVSVFEKERVTDYKAWTVVNRYETEKGIVSVKRQCMHCNQAACASACLVNAMLKKEDGPVIWRGSKCMGCRYCMVSCPFDMPKYEYHSVIPKVQKCTYCFSRQEEGKLPACVEACPVEALRFGSRREMLKIAKSRIARQPDEYYNEIYGEQEAGGTSWMYLSKVPFDQIGFNTGISKTPYPEFTKGFLYGVPVVFVLWPTFLAGMSILTRRREQADEADNKKADEKETAKKEAPPADDAKE